MRHRWGWLLAFGLFSALMGLAALALTASATIASVLLIGVFMILAGAVEIGMGFRMRDWGRMVLWEAAGLVYIVAGLFAVLVPELASVVLTLLLGAGLLATGILRIILGMRMWGTPAGSALALAGLVTAMLGLLIVVGWPGNSFLVLGTILGIDLLLYGITWTTLALRLRPRHR